MLDARIFSPDNLHIVASDSGAGWLKHCAYELDARDRTILCFGASLLDVGPLSAIVRHQELFPWLKANAPGLIDCVGFDLVAEDWYNQKLHRAWDDIRTWPGAITLWHSSRDVREASFQAAFVRYAPRVLDVDMVNVADMPFADGTAPATGECTGDRLFEAHQRRYRLSKDTLNRELSLSENLINDPSGVRIFQNGRLANAPLDIHDQKILARLGNEWRGVGEVCKEIFDSDRARGVRELGYFFFLWRVDQLCRLGGIERRGQEGLCGNPHAGEMRLSPK